MQSRMFTARVTAAPSADRSKRRPSIKTALTDIRSGGGQHGLQCSDRYTGEYAPASALTSCSRPFPLTLLFRPLNRSI